MNLTAKSRYAIKIMTALAQDSEEKVTKREKISKQHSIPKNFMDQITSRLKAHKLITTTRGPLGGLKIAKKPEQISVWDIFEAVEDNLKPVSCLESEDCSLIHQCISQDIWFDIYQQTKAQMCKLTLNKYMTPH